MVTGKKLGPSKRKSGSKKRKARNYSANEATLININALKKRVAELEIIALRHRHELNTVKEQLAGINFFALKGKYSIKDFAP